MGRPPDVPALDVLVVSRPDLLLPVLLRDEVGGTDAAPVGTVLPRLPGTTTQVGMPYMPFS